MFGTFRKRDQLIERFLEAAGGHSWIVKRALENVARQRQAPGQELPSDQILQEISKLRRGAAA